MTNKPAHHHGYSKKELTEIIEKIDADRNFMRNQTEKPNTNLKDNRSCFKSKYGENR